MAKISSFIFCDNVQQQFVQGNGVVGNVIFNLINPLQVLSPYTIPGSFSFSFSIGLSDFDTTIQNTLCIKFRDPFEKIVTELSDVPLPPMPKDVVTLPLEYRSIRFNADIRNALIEHSGLYSMLVIFNNEAIGEFSIPAYPLLDRVQGAKK